MSTSPKYHPQEAYGHWAANRGIQIKCGSGDRGHRIRVRLHQSSPVQNGVDPCWQYATTLSSLTCLASLTVFWPYRFNVDLPVHTCSILADTACRRGQSSGRPHQRYHPPNAVAEAASESTWHSTVHIPLYRLIRLSFDSLFSPAYGLTPSRSQVISPPCPSSFYQLD